MTTLWYLTLLYHEKNEKLSLGHYNWIFTHRPNNIKIKSKILLKFWYLTHTQQRSVNKFDYYVLIQVLTYLKIFILYFYFRINCILSVYLCHVACFPWSGVSDFHLYFYLLLNEFESVNHLSWSHWVVLVLVVADFNYYYSSHLNTLHVVGYWYSS